MIERFFFDRIDAKASASTVRVENHLIPFDLADKAKAAISFFHCALTRAQIAHNTICANVPMPPLSNV